MSRLIRARDVDAMLAYAGFELSAFDQQTGWAPGYRVTQGDRRLVRVFHDGDGEQEQLAVYAALLESRGYSVVHEQQPGGGRRRLAVTKP
ncbi:MULTISPECIES: hypothetical protein [unclassified Streptomyces]|uniref:hypothetical protein n=1 Tax=unclassified Streptomyces TaxID=2593676 RepID=UPI0033E4D8B1